MAFKVTHLPTEQEQTPPVFSLTVNPSRIAQDIAGFAAAPIKGAKNLIGAIGSAATALGEATKPTGIPQLSPEQYAGLSGAAGGLLETVGEKLVPQSVREYLEPTGEFQESIQSAIGNIPALATAGLGIVPAAVSAFGSETGKKVAEKLGLGDTGQLLGSIFGSFGANVLASGGTVGQLKKFVNNKYNAFEVSIPKGLKQSTTNVQNVIDNIENQIKSRKLVHSEGALLKDEIKHIKKLIKLGTIGTEKAFKETQRLNELFRHPETSSAAKKEILNLSRGFRDDIVAAKQIAPQLRTQDLLDANQMYYGMYSLSPLRKMLRTWVTPKKLGAIAAGKVIAPEIPSAILGSAPAALINKLFLGAPLARAGVEIAESAFKSPEIAKYIGRTAGEAARRTVPIATSKIFEPKNRYKITNLPE